MFETWNVSEIPFRKLYSNLTTAIAPRPIAWVSSINTKGEVNLAPFSFFNLFSIQPPTVIFASVKSKQTRKHKDTYFNAKETKEVVINIVSYALAPRANVSSAPYPYGVNEFPKAGVTELPSQLVRPPRVKEAPIQMECKVKNIIELGDVPGSGALIICEILQMHIHKNVLDENGNIDQNRLDLAARLGKIYYCRAQGEALFEIPRPQGPGIGWENLPQFIKESSVLSAKDVAAFALLPKIPELKTNETWNTIIHNAENYETCEHLAKELIQTNKIEDAFRLLMLAAKKYNP